MSTVKTNPIPKQRGLAPKYWVLICVVFGIFMVVLDTTVVNVAFPTLRDEFKASISDAQWIISVYILALGISTPLAAYLANRFGMKRIFLAGLAIFSIGSFLCGIAPNLLFLTVMRCDPGVWWGHCRSPGTSFFVSNFPSQGTGLRSGNLRDRVTGGSCIGTDLGWVSDRPEPVALHLFH